jgi:hypothetical protein
MSREVVVIGGSAGSHTAFREHEGEAVLRCRESGKTARSNGSLGRDSRRREQPCRRRRTPRRPMNQFTLLSRWWCGRCRPAWTAESRAAEDRWTGSPWRRPRAVPTASSAECGSRSRAGSGIAPTSASSRRHRRRSSALYPIPDPVLSSSLDSGEPSTIWRPGVSHRPLRRRSDVDRDLRVGRHRPLSDRTTCRGFIGSAGASARARTISPQRRTHPSTFSRQDRSPRR